MNDQIQKSDEAVQDQAGIPAPSIGEFLRPRWFFGFLRAFIGSWFLSRNYRAFFAGAPALVFAFAGAIATWRLAQPPDEVLADTYQRAAINATQLESHAESDLMWERLMQLRPDDPRYRFVLVQSLTERGELAAAGRHLEVLTADDGYTPARLWLVQQAREESPSFPLTTEQQIFQLQAAVKADPQNTESHRLLAQTYIEREDYRLAEQHLLHAADDHPTLGLLLYELQTKLQRQDTEKGRRYLESAALGFERMAIEMPQNAETRIYWAQTLDYLGRSDEAEAILSEAVRVVDSDELRAAASTFMIRRAQRMVAQSSLNLPAAVAYVRKAAAINPANPTLPNVCIALIGLGADLPDETISPVVSHLESKIAEDPDDVRNFIVLANLLLQQGQHDQAIALLEPKQEDNSTVQALLVRALRLADREPEADQLSDSLLSGLRAKASEDDGPGPTIELAGVLIGTQKYQQAITLIEEWRDRSNLAPHELPMQLKQYYIAGCTALYREMSEQNVDDREAFGMLTKATETRQVTTEILQLIAKLAYGQSSVAKEAEEMLTRFLAGGQANEQIYASLGTEALSGGNVDAAVSHLQLALAQAPTNPVVQNNLALALVRQSPDNAIQALNLCNKALDTVPGQPDILSTRAEIQVARSRWPEARIDLETALPDRPQSKLVRRLLVRVYTELGEPGLAAEHQAILDQILQAEQDASGTDIPAP